MKKYNRRRTYHRRNSKSNRRRSIKKRSRRTITKKSRRTISKKSRRNNFKGGDKPKLDTRANSSPSGLLMIKDKTY